VLEKLTVTNFQGLKKVTVNFSPTVTTIIGPNDKGKSAFLRALKWVTTNKRPRGRIIRDGTKRCSAVLTVDGHVVRRSTSTRGNHYSLDKKRFKAFGTRVPVAIKSLISLDEINFQHQHDSLFWLALSPGHLARELNKLVDLDSIDKAQTWVTQRLRSTQLERDICTNRLHDGRLICERLQPTKKLAFHINELDKLCKLTYDEYASRIAGLRALTQGVSRIRQTIRTCQVASRQAGRAVRVHQQIAALRSSCDAGNVTIGALRRLLSSIREARTLSRLCVPSTSKLNRLIHQQTMLKQQIDELSSLLTKSKALETETHELVERSVKLKAKLEERLGGRCALCGGILTDRSLI